MATFSSFKKREQWQQQNQQIWLESAVKMAMFFPFLRKKSKILCLDIAESLGLENDSPRLVIQWQHQLNEAYSAQEIAHLFSRHVLSSFDTS